MKNIDELCTRKQFLIGSGAAAVGLFCGRRPLQAQPGISPSAPALSTTPESADNVPDFPEHHPRMDIFAATMLGKLDIVEAAVAAFPNIVQVPGPHGIPLIVHAERGGPA